MLLAFVPIGLSWIGRTKKSPDLVHFWDHDDGRFRQLGLGPYFFVAVKIGNSRSLVTVLFRAWYAISRNHTGPVWLLVLLLCYLVLVYLRSPSSSGEAGAGRFPSSLPPPTAFLRGLFARLGPRCGSARVASRPASTAGFARPTRACLLFRRFGGSPLDMKCVFA